MLKSKVFSLIVTIVAVSVFIWIFLERRPDNQAAVPTLTSRSSPSEGTSPAFLDDVPALSERSTGDSRKEELEPVSTLGETWQSLSIAELSATAAGLLASSETPDYVPPPVPPELEKKLRDLSPALLALVKLAARVPPRQVNVNKDPNPVNTASSSSAPETKW